MATNSTTCYRADENGRLLAISNQEGLTITPIATDFSVLACYQRTDCVLLVGSDEAYNYTPATQTAKLLEHVHVQTLRHELLPSAVQVLHPHKKDMLLLADTDELFFENCSPLIWGKDWPPYEDLIGFWSPHMPLPGYDFQLIMAFDTLGYYSMRWECDKADSYTYMPLRYECLSAAHLVSISPWSLGSHKVPHARTADGAIHLVNQLSPIALKLEPAGTKLPQPLTDFARYHCSNIGLSEGKVYLEFEMARHPGRVFLGDVDEIAVVSGYLFCRGSKKCWVFDVYRINHVAKCFRDGESWAKIPRAWAIETEVMFVLNYALPEPRDLPV